MVTAAPPAHPDRRPTSSAARSARPPAAQLRRSVDPADGRARSAAVARSRRRRRRARRRPPPRRRSRPGPALTVAERGALLRAARQLLERDAERSPRSSPRETGKSPKEARRRVRRGDRDGLLRRRRGPPLLRPHHDQRRARTSQAMTVRQPLGVAGLIIAANTPIANVAWKAFPALLCGNAAVLKASEDTPRVAAGLRPAGARGGRAARRCSTSCTASATRPARRSSSTRTWPWSASPARARSAAGSPQTAGERLAKVCLELGGKNPLIVCDDADLEDAVTAAASRPSATPASAAPPAAGSSCSTPSTTRSASCWSSARPSSRSAPPTTDDFGPVINERQIDNMLGAVEAAQGGGRVGADRRRAADRRGLRRRLLRRADAGRGRALDDEIPRSELFGPIAWLYRVARLRGGASRRPTTRRSG